MGVVLSALPFFMEEHHRCLAFIHLVHPLDSPELTSQQITNMLCILAYLKKVVASPCDPAAIR